jgi:hypothetical protein
MYTLVEGLSKFLPTTYAIQFATNTLQGPFRVGQVSVKATFDVAAPPAKKLLGDPLGWGFAFRKFAGW